MRYFREAPEFTEQCKRLALDIRMLDSIRDGIEWVLREDVTWYPAVPGTPYRVAHTAEYPGKPSLILFYEIVDLYLVEFKWIEENTDEVDEPIKW